MVLSLCTGRYSEQYVMEFYTQTLLSKPCQNQGFILDGFPKTYEQAKTLFEGVSLGISSPSFPLSLPFSLTPPIPS